jgi:hypothetical protein
VNDDVERRLSVELSRLPLPSAPIALRDRVQALPERAPGRRARAGVGRRWAGLAVAAALVLGAVATLLMSAGGALQMLPASSGLPEPPPSATRTAPPQPSLLAAVDGHPILTVSQVLAERAAGKLGKEPVALRGYWTALGIAHSCAAPQGNPGVLEIYCHVGEYGITERNEPIAVMTRRGELIPGKGPWLTPYLENTLPQLAEMASLPAINGQPFPPVPIIVLGHFDDPRVSECRSEAKKICADRYVVDRVVEFNPDVVPTPAPTPSPTPFPFTSPPTPPFGVQDCSEGNPVEFAGWKTFGELGIDLGDPNEILYVVILREPIVIGDWIKDPAGSGQRFRTWGQRVCYAHEWEEGAIGYTTLPRTAYREWEDGRREPIPAP